MSSDKLKILWQGKIPDQLHTASSAWHKFEHRLVFRKDHGSVLGEYKAKDGNWFACTPSVEQYLCERWIAEQNGAAKPKLKELAK